MLCTVSQDTETRGTTSNTWLRLHDSDLCCRESHGRIKAAGNDPETGESRPARTGDAPQHGDDVDKDIPF